MIDTHCHLGEDAAAVVERARDAGVRWLIDVGIDAASTRAARERAHGLAGWRIVAARDDSPAGGPPAIKRSRPSWSSRSDDAATFGCGLGRDVIDGVRFTAGLHPCEAERLDDEWDVIAAAAGDPRCVAVGETGYDFHHRRASDGAQRLAFERHLELRVRLDKPVVVHCREAFDATFATIAAHRDARCVLHCFSGGIADARRALDLGCVLSFAGPLTYPRADALREAAAFAPDERIVVETDAPFLPPRGRRGQRNEPAWVAAVVEQLATVRGTTVDAAAALTTANAMRVFAL